jgi:tryptophanyl-tRNA synthetase
MSKKIILTGDRPTGPLHLGHFVGSLENRIRLQDEYDQFVMIADLQAMTDNFDNPKKVLENINEVLLDYISCGIDPEKTTIFLQSQIWQLSELTMIFMNFVGLGRLFRNPTLKNEIKQKNFSEDFLCETGQSLKMGFLSYPVSQAADISLFKADLVPVGEDQLPMIEQTNEITAKFNSIYGVNFFAKVKALVGSQNRSGLLKGRLSGLDGKAKMSKSLNNAIFLKDSNDEISKKVNSAFTDPLHIKISDPGRIEGNVVFEYLDVFYEDKDDLEKLKNHYVSGGLGDMVLKNKLKEILIELIIPIRSKREELSKEKDFLNQVLKNGTAKAKQIAKQNFAEIKKIMGYEAFL